MAMELAGKVLSTAAMREADRRCIEVLGIPGGVLMNNAGAAVYRETRGDKVGVVCFKGNNGGDGFVVARLALLDGRDVEVVLLAERDELKGDAATFFHVYERLGGKVTVAADESSAAKAVGALGDCDTLVDGVLGTGVTGELRGVPGAAVEAWPDVDTVAVDLPTGMNSDTGEIGGRCVRGSVTVTFQFAKKGFMNPDAQSCLGRLVIADIGIPEVCADDDAWKALGLEG